jgi:hypothetical protein
LIKLLRVEPRVRTKGKVGAIELENRERPDEHAAKEREYAARLQQEERTHAIQLKEMELGA